MPELPEVEIVRAGLAQTIVNRRVVAVVARAPALRWPLPSGLGELIRERAPRCVQRRGKYLLIEFEHGWLIMHLGMSGSVCFAAAAAPVRPHDHLDIVFEHGLLRLNDPRRFGAVLWHARDDGPIDAHPLLRSLGVEPFSQQFDAALLHRATRGRRASIKQVLLSGQIVVGVGNIYASESLFRAAIRPTTPAYRLGRERCARLVDAIRATLTSAIGAGGSTLRDFVSASGESGHFQLECFVYGRDGAPCRVCGNRVRMIRQQQRATYYCTSCQR